MRNVICVGLLTIAAIATHAAAQQSWGATPEPFFLAPSEVHAVGDRAESLIAVDIDGDGRQDLVAGNRGNADIHILLYGAAAPVAVFAGPGPRSIAAGDVDGDGDIDLVTANYRGGTVSILINVGGLEFAPPVYHALGRWPGDVALGDFDADGDLDLLATTEDDEAITGAVWILENDGDGAFEMPKVASRVSFPNHIAIADLDGDGDSDVAVGGFVQTFVMLNDGNAGFETITYAVAAGRIVSADIDRDGDTDLLASTWFDDGVYLLRNGGNATFAAERVSFHRGTGVTAGDLDGDGDLDFAEVHSYYMNRLTVWRNRGDGTFSFATQLSTGGQALDVLAFDRDGDSVTDIAFVNFDKSTVSIMLTVPGISSVAVASSLKEWVIQLNHDDLAVSSAHDASNYRGFTSGNDVDYDGNAFNDGDERLITNSSIAYDTVNNRIHVSTGDTLFGELLRFEIDGDDATTDDTPGLADPDGNFVAGGDATIVLDLRIASLVKALQARVALIAAIDRGRLAGLLQAASRVSTSTSGNNPAISHQLEQFVEALNSVDDGVLEAAVRDSLAADASFILNGLRLTQ